MANYSANYILLRHAGQLSLLLLLIFHMYTKARVSDRMFTLDSRNYRGEANPANKSYAVHAADLF